MYDGGDWGRVDWVIYVSVGSWLLFGNCFQYIRKYTTLSELSYTFAIAPSSPIWPNIPCTYVTMILLMSTQTWFLKPPKPRDTQNCCLFCVTKLRLLLSMENDLLLRPISYKRRLRSLLLKHHHSIAERSIRIASSHCPESLEKRNTIPPVRECKRPKRR